MKTFCGKLTILVCVLGSFLLSCKKEDKKSETGDLEIYTQEQIDNLDQTTDVKWKLSDIVLPNEEAATTFLPDYDTAFFNLWSTGRFNHTLGTLGPLDSKNLLIKKLTSIALNTIDRSKHPYSGQNGIAYSYGAKDYSIKQKPSASQCPAAINGIDCSGLLYQLFKNAGISGFPEGNAELQRQPATIQKALSQSYPDLKKIKVEDLGRLDKSKIVNGDIVYWMNEDGKAFHIGMILKNKSGQLAVFQSNGSPGGSDKECAANTNLKRGPRAFELNDKYWFSTKAKYGVVRFNFEIQGTWEFHMRCQNTTRDVIVLTLEFPPSASKNFQIGKDYIDYDGSQNHADFSFVYDNSDNTLSCTMVNRDGGLPNYERKDKFMLVLKRDDSGYFPIQLVSLVGGTGCQAEARIINKE